MTPVEAVTKEGDRWWPGWFTNGCSSPERVKEVGGWVLKDFAGVNGWSQLSSVWGKHGGWFAGDGLACFSGCRYQLVEWHGEKKGGGKRWFWGWREKVARERREKRLCDCYLLKWLGLGGVYVLKRRKIGF